MYGSRWRLIDESQMYSQYNNKLLVYNGGFFQKLEQINQMKHTLMIEHTL